MAQQIESKIELGMPKFEADSILKAQITDNIMSLHNSLTNPDNNKENFQFLVDMLITCITPFEAQDAMFDLKEELVNEYTTDLKDKQEIDKKIMEANIKIVGLCRIQLAKYHEKRLAIMYGSKKDKPV